MSTTMKRRDLLEACKLTGITLDELQKSSEGQLAIAYLIEKRAGDTDLEFDAWLDEDIDVEIDQDDEGDVDPS